MNYAEVDYETYYDEDCSVTTLGIDGYIAHPKFDAYLVSIVTDDWEWVGHPKDAPWDKIHGQDWEWNAWNASFDERIYQHLQETGVVGPFAPRLWNCLADLSCYCAAPRALAASSLYLYKEKVSKTIRDKMKGVIYATLSPEKQAAVNEYALTDGRKARRMRVDRLHLWPEKERRLSRLTRQQGWRGLRIDRERVERGIDHLKIICWTAQQMIPWGGDAAALSYPMLCAECKKVGIEAPKSVAKNDEECAAWEELHGDKFKWIDAMRVLRSANALLKKLETMRDRIRPDGRMGYACKYFGAHTGRWSGGGGGEKKQKETGFNPQNLPRGEMFGEEFFLGKLRDDGTRESPKGKNFLKLWEEGMEGIDLRKCIIPAEGCHFVSCDLSQIEPRVLWSFAGDTTSLGLVRQGFTPYGAHEVTTMGATEPSKKGTPTYQLSKARVLALGYGAGWLKFISMARLYISEDECARIFAAPVSESQSSAFYHYLTKCRNPQWLKMWKDGTPELKTTYVNSWLIVMGFRRSNNKIVKLWKKLDIAVRKACEKGEDLEVELPSGRSILYKNVAEKEGDITGIVIKFGRPTRVKLYGGLLVENLVQAAARDVFADCLLRLDDAGHWTAVHIHDEAVTEIPLSVQPNEIELLMSQPPEWMKLLPVASEASSTMYYTK